MEELGDFPGRLKKEEDAHAEVGRLPIACWDSGGFPTSPVTPYVWFAPDPRAFLVRRVLLLVLTPLESPPGKRLLLIVRCSPFFRRSRQTAHGVSRLVQALSAWSVISPTYPVLAL